MQQPRATKNLSAEVGLAISAARHLVGGVEAFLDAFDPGRRATNEGVTLEAKAKALKDCHERLAFADERIHEVVVRLRRVVTIPPRMANTNLVAASPAERSVAEAYGVACQARNLVRAAKRCLGQAISRGVLS